MLMEVMGLHMPGTAFINPGTALRDALTVAATERVMRITALGEEYTPLSEVVDEKSIVNAMVGLAATGGSTNHAIHLVAIAARPACGSTGTTSTNCRASPRCSPASTRTAAPT